jgi:hypothetical protein
MIMARSINSMHGPCKSSLFIRNVMAPSRKEVSVKLPLKQVDPLPIGVVLYVIGALIMEESPWRRFSLFPGLLFSAILGNIQCSSSSKAECDVCRHPLSNNMKNGKMHPIHRTLHHYIVLCVLLKSPLALGSREQLYIHHNHKMLFSSC